jgi:hypothetical protein
MEWLKKHWEILAAIAVGIPVLYWLYQKSATGQISSAQAAQDASLQNAEQQATADYAQQVGLSNLMGGYGGGGGGGTGGGPIQSTQSGVASSQPQIVDAQPTLSTPPTSQPSIPADFAIPANQNPDYSYSQNPSVANNPNPIYAPGSPQAIALGYSSGPIMSALNTVFGSGGSTNDTAPVATQGVAPDLSHISNGMIPTHGTALPKSPTPTELASIGGRGTR